MVALAKAKPGGLNAAVSGSGTLLSAEFFKLSANTPLTIISYKAAPEAAVALISGEVDIGFIDIPSIATQIAAGKVNAQAVTTGKRIRLLPDVPTVAEAGIGLQGRGLAGRVRRRGDPAGHRRAHQQGDPCVGHSPEISARIIQLGGEPADHPGKSSRRWSAPKSRSGRTWWRGPR